MILLWRRTPIIFRREQKPWTSLWVLARHSLLPRFAPCRCGWFVVVLARLFAPLAPPRGWVVGGCARAKLRLFQNWLFPSHGFSIRGLQSGGSVFCRSHFATLLQRRRHTQLSCVFLCCHDVVPFGRLDCLGDRPPPRVRRVRDWDNHHRPLRWSRGGGKKNARVGFGQQVRRQTHDDCFAHPQLGTPVANSSPVTPSGRVHW